MEVILGDFKNAPSCSHGPCLMFERYSSDGNKTGRRFFACSSCRNRSDCNIFQWVDDEVSLQTKKYWKLVIEKSKPQFSHEECVQRLYVFKKTPIEKRKYCKTCSVLILPDENQQHLNHKLMTNLKLEDLKNPSCLFKTIQNNKAEAQYFFTEETVKFVVSLLENLGFSKLILIGVPKIHEYIQNYSTISSFLMDIDHRYMQFYNTDNFCQYNVFNNHFFDGENSIQHFKDFLTEQNGRKIAILLDPPFGGLVDSISYTLKKINECWREKNNKSALEHISFLWFFPYFMEGRILKSLPDVLMMDYKVEYENHKKFGARTNIKGSPVRIFTNIDQSSFVLPENLGYWFCEKCKRYVSKENKHCFKCNSCTTKHGKTYNHCDLCQQCVKSSYKHCLECNKCELEDHACVKLSSSNNLNETSKRYISEVCHKCSGLGHRKRNCPVNISRNPKKRKFKKKYPVQEHETKLKN